MPQHISSDHGFSQLTGQLPVEFGNRSFKFPRMGTIHFDALTTRHMIGICWQSNRRLKSSFLADGPTV